jgi:acetyl-CoA carboxylase alpha subunit
VAPTGRTAGEGDIVVVRDAETYDLGTTIEYGGVKHTVARDLSDFVELVTPEVSRPLRGGGALRIAAGNTVTMAKSDLALALMR